MNKIQTSYIDLCYGGDILYVWQAVVHVESLLDVTYISSISMTILMKEDWAAFYAIGMQSLCFELLIMLIWMLTKLGTYICWTYSSGNYASNIELHVFTSRIHTLLFISAVIHEPNGPQETSQYEHSSIPATVKKLFNLHSNFLTKRDAWAGTFENYFKIRKTPRTDCPGMYLW